MLIVLACAVLILAVGMVVLFAMFGELSVRVTEAGKVRRNTDVRPLERAQLGQVPASWPQSIGDSTAEEFTALVLSSACASCADIAVQLISQPGHRDWLNMGVVVSTSDRQTGEEFIARNGLEVFPHYVDVGGEWVSGEFGVRMSPSALIFRAGQLSSAYQFQDVAALRAALKQATAAGGRQASNGRKAESRTADDSREADKEAAWTDRPV